MRSTFVFLHAHPDDESIFTGGTIAQLTAAGHRVVVVYATSGELGRGEAPGIGHRRRSEARTACDILGVERVVFLDHHDSGIHADRRLRPWGAFADVHVEVVAEQLAAIVDGERARALVVDDVGGIYGHPDHIHANRVGALASRMAEIESWYDVTLDREYLHFVDAHVAHLAGSSLPVPRRIGRPTVEISVTVDVRTALSRKLVAVAAHASQTGGDPTFGSGAGFADVYGYEWFVRHGAPTALDRLDVSTRHASRALA
jgi:LmbE family N-acetylglucosaminyl deacetylase